MMHLRSSALILLTLWLFSLQVRFPGRAVALPKGSLESWAGANRAWLQRQVTPNRAVTDPNPARRRLIVSYDISPEDSPYGFHRSATYDNALAALTFLIGGDADRAAFTLHALARLIRPNGSLWFSYNTRNSWPDESYHESAIVRAGAVAWVGYAFTFYLTHAPPCPDDDRGCGRERAFFLESAVRLAEYLLSLQVDDPSDSRFGLVRLGYGTIELDYRKESNEVIEVYLDEPALGVSTENNISAWFSLRQLGQLTGETRWIKAADRIRQSLLRATWNEETGQFNRGFHGRGEADTVRALDCASWGTLFLLAGGEREKARRTLEAIEAYYPAQDGDALGYSPYFDLPIFKTSEVGEYFFPGNPRIEWRGFPLVWSEGTLGVALAHLRMGQIQRARKIVERLRSLQVEGSGLRYASREVPHQMADVPSVAASAWLVLVAENMAGNNLAQAFWR